MPRMIARHKIELNTLELLASLLPTGGDAVNRFREELVRYYGISNDRLFLTPSGRCGLYLLFKMLPQKKVILPAFDCRAVVEAALLAGKEVDYVDISDRDFNMDPQDLARRITPDSIVVATNQLGIPCRLDEVEAICRAGGAVMLEDNAAGFGAEYKGRKTGLWGSASILSFEYTKVLTAGRGGAVIINDDALLDRFNSICEEELAKPRLKTLLSYARYIAVHNLLTTPFLYGLIFPLWMKRKGAYTDTGALNLERNALYTDLFTPFQARMALKLLERIGAVIARRREIAEIYRKGLDGLDPVTVPQWEEGAVPALMRFPILVQGDKIDFFGRMQEEGVDLGFTFSYVCGGEEVERRCPNSLKVARSVLNLPLSSKLSLRDAESVVKAVRRVVKSRESA